MSRPEPIQRSGASIPEYREVEEHGRVVIKLMKEIWWTTTYPDWRELVKVPPPSGVDLAYEYVDHPSQTIGQSQWVEA